MNSPHLTAAVHAQQRPRRNHYRHTAPSVRWALAPGRVVKRIVYGLIAAGVGVMGGWSVYLVAYCVVGAGFLCFLGWLVWTISAAAALHWLRMHPRGVLEFQAGRWTWHAPAATGTGTVTHSLHPPHLAIDVQWGILAVFQRPQPSVAPVHMWLEQSSASQHWADLRRALYSPRQLAAL